MDTKSFEKTGLNIAPLIPLPPPSTSSGSSHEATSTTHPDQRDEYSEELIDKFATLFSPATPRASPNGSPKVSVIIPSTAHKPEPSTHSSDDEFGSFVCVPPGQAPLIDDSDNNNHALETHHSDNTAWSFFDEAKARDERNRTNLLSELDGPIFSDHPPPSPPPDHHHNPTPSQQDVSNSPSAMKDISSSSPPSLKRLGVRRSPTLTMSPPTLAPPQPSESLMTLFDDPLSVLPDSTPSLTSPHRRAQTEIPHLTLPNKKNSPTQAHDPSSPHHHTSYSTLTALSARWMSNMLSHGITHHSHQSHHTHQPHHSQTLPTPLATEYHSSPFAPKTPYIPPSGAPGYQGEREGWDKDGKWYGALEKDLMESENKSTTSLASSVSSTNTNGSGGTATTGTKLYKMSALMTASLPPLNLNGFSPMTTPVLTPDLAAILRLHLPPLRRLKEKWELLYSLDQHGVSLSTLYSRCDKLGSGTPFARRLGEFANGGSAAVSTSGAELGTVLVIQDSDGNIFGAWMGERLRGTESGYFGTGESFLWRRSKDGEIQVFKWTGINDYVALCQEDFISFGGGDGSYGLYLDSALDEGSSARCPTFNNPPLCGDHERDSGMRRFECVGLEVWGV